MIKKMKLKHYSEPKKGNQFMIATRASGYSTVYGFYKTLSGAARALSNAGSGYNIYKNTPHGSRSNTWEKVQI